MHSTSSSNFFLRPGCTSTQLFSKRTIFSVHLSDSSMRDFLERSNFFTDETKKVVLTCLCLERRYNNYNFWSFTMHSISSSNFFLRPWCTSTPFYPKREIYSVHLSDSSRGDLLKRSNFFIDETKKVVLTCPGLERRYNNYKFWSFTMHSISSSNFFLRPRCTSTPLLSKRGRFSVHLSDSSMGGFLKRSYFFTHETKEVVLTCLRLETVSSIYYFWNLTMHSISSSNFFLRPGCTSTPLFSKRARFSVHLSDSSMGDFLKRSLFFPDETKEVVLTCLRLETVSSIYYFWNFTMHSISSSRFLLRPWCNCTPFYPKRARYSVQLNDSSMGDFLKRSNFFTDETKKVVLTCLRLETRSNVQYFWSFIMHSSSSSNFFLRPWCTSTPFYFKRTRYSVHLSDSSKGIF